MTSGWNIGELDVPLGVGDYIFTFIIVGDDGKAGVSHQYLFSKT